MAQRKHLIVGGAVLVAAAAGYWAWAGYEKLAQQRSVIQSVAQATTELRNALASAPAPGATERIDAALERARAPRDPQLAEAAQQYLTTAREIVRRRAATDKLSQDAAQARQALAAHLAHASGRGAGWIHQATELKKTVEGRYFDLGSALKAQADLLYGLPASEKGLAPDLVLEPEVALKVRQQVLEQAARATAELQKARRLGP